MKHAYIVSFTVLHEYGAADNEQALKQVTEWADNFLPSNCILLSVRQATIAPVPEIAPYENYSPKDRE